jgi:hypothetical protein
MNKDEQFAQLLAALERIVQVLQQINTSLRIKP